MNNMIISQFSMKPFKIKVAELINYNRTRNLRAVFWFSFDNNEDSFPDLQEIRHLSHGKGVIPRDSYM